MRLNFALLYEPMQKSAGTAGTAGTSSNHAALTVPACPKMPGTRGDKSPPHVTGRKDARPNLSPLSPNRPHPRGHGKPSIHAAVPVVPVVPTKNHINEIDREVFEERLALSPAGSIKASGGLTMPAFLSGGGKR